jgi:hypothetical protein
VIVTGIARHGTKDKEDAGEEVCNQGIDTVRVGDLGGDRVEGVDQHKEEPNQQV